MSRVTESLRKQKEELMRELAQLANPILKEIRQVNKALEALGIQEPKRIYKQTAGTNMTPSKTQDYVVNNSYPGTDAEYSAEMDLFFANWDHPDPRDFLPASPIAKDYLDEGCDETCKGCDICRRGWDYR